MDRFLVFAIDMDHIVHILRLGTNLLIQLFEPFHELEALPLHDLRDLFVEVFEHLFSLCCLVCNILLNVHHVIFKLVHGQGELSEVLSLGVVLQSLLIDLNLFVHLHHIRVHFGL